MKGKILIVVLIQIILISCSSNKPERKIEGIWIRHDQRKFELKSGVMIIQSTGYIFANYTFLDENTIRLQRQSKSSNWDWLIEVRFPSNKTMVWYREIGNKRNKLWEFRKME